MQAKSAPGAEQDFLIAHGGPFYALQERLGLLHADALQAGRRALLAVGIAWGVPLLLAALAGHAWDGAPGSRPFLLDLGAWARFLVAVGVLVLSERAVERRLRFIQRQFLEAPLLAPASVPAAGIALLQALRRRDSHLAELAILVTAILITIMAAGLKLDSDASAWLAQPGPDGAPHFTLAGWCAVSVSAPLFWFLTLRWLWRHLVWALLLRDIAGLELRLVATHPDGYGGLGFIGEYPNAFAAFVFALTAVVAAETLQAMAHGKLADAAFPYVMGVWVVFVVVLFALPLAVFKGPLGRLKQDALMGYNAAAIRSERASERRLLGHNIVASAETEAEAQPVAGDLTKTYAIIRKLGTIPVTKASLLPLGVAAVVPLIAVGVTQMPFKELLKVAKMLLL